MSNRRTELIDLLRQTSTRLSPKVRAEIADLLEGMEDGRVADALSGVRDIVKDRMPGRIRTVSDIPGKVRAILAEADKERSEASAALEKAMRVIGWFLNGKIGAASKAIVRRMLGIAPRRNRVHFREDTYYPRDANEFGRCMMMLDLFPEWRERIADMVEVSPEWAVLVVNWPKIEAEFRAEAEGKATAGSTENRIQAALLSLKEPARVVAYEQ